MNLATIDIIIICAYLVGTLLIGFWVSSKASDSMKSYFLGGNSLSWFRLGLSNASGQFDISGTMLMVYWLFVFGLKSVYLPWLWPAFNQIFLMIFLSIWLRRSGVMTGAEWITFRFGNGHGATLSHLSVVVFALLLVLGYLAYGFIGIGKFAAVFLPWELSKDDYWNEVYYGLIVTTFTAIYVVKGGMYAVVFTEILQFFIMTIACLGVGLLAMYMVTPEMIQKAIPPGWMDMSVHWKIGIDWTEKLPAAQEKIKSEGMEIFGLFVGMVFMRGVLVSMAGPAPNYDMQRILSTRSPKEAAKMSAFVNVALLVPRYMLITGLSVLALVFFMDDLQGMGSNVDFEKILPFAIKNYIPAGLSGLLIAGLLAAYMSSFAATSNAAPAYVVNDIYKKYINPNAKQKTYVKMSYIATITFVVIGTLIGLLVPSLNDIVLWIVGALFGGYVAANTLKWYWWRFNGYGYFFGMVTAIVISVPLIFIDMSAVIAFPIIFALCLTVCVVASLVTKPDDMGVLKEFYLKTRPWGAWGPVLRELQMEDPDIQPNNNFKVDMLNVAVGLVWHTALTATGIFLVVQNWLGFVGSVATVLITSLVLKYNWYDRIQNYPVGYTLKNT